MIRQLLAAVSFLTRIPVRSGATTEQELGKSARWFPLVGVMLGGAYAAIAWLLAPRFPAPVVAIILLCMDALLTGALHLDGLADMADGFGGGRTRDDVLRIMRDHAIGSYGATALICLLLLKAAGLAALIAGRQYLWILIAAPALSRWGIVLLSQIAPYARPAAGDPGTGALARYIGPLELVIATLVCVWLPFVFGVTRTLLCWVAVATVTAAMAGYCRRHIGGITGDTLGANTVITEAVQLLVALGMARL